MHTHACTHTDATHPHTGSVNGHYMYHSPSLPRANLFYPFLHKIRINKILPTPKSKPTHSGSGSTGGGRDEKEGTINGFPYLTLEDTLFDCLKLLSRTKRRCAPVLRKRQRGNNRYTHMHPRMHICIPVYAHASTYTHVYTHEIKPVYLCMYPYLCIYPCLCIFGRMQMDECSVGCKDLMRA